MAMEGRCSGQAGKRDTEMAFLLGFARESDLSDGRNRDWLRMLWTAYCLHWGLDVDTLAYDSTALAIWAMVEEADTADWNGYDGFSNFMARYLV